MFSSWLFSFLRNISKMTRLEWKYLKAPADSYYHSFSISWSKLGYFKVPCKNQIPKHSLKAFACLSVKIKTFQRGPISLCRPKACNTCGWEAAQTLAILNNVGFDTYRVLFRDFKKKFYQKYLFINDETKLLWLE